MKRLLMLPVMFVATLLLAGCFGLMAYLAALVMGQPMAVFVGCPVAIVAFVSKMKQVVRQYRKWYGKR